MAVGFNTEMSCDRNKQYNGRVTKFVILSCMMASMGGVLFRYDIGISGGVTSMEPFLRIFFPKVYRRKEDKDISNYCKFDSQLLTSFTSSLYIVGLVASFFASSVTRAFGRKPSILIGGAAFLIGTAFGAAAANIYMLILGCILLGVGVGFANQAVPLYLSEMVPSKYRGAISNGFQLSISLGVLSANLINFGTEKIKGGSGWRISLAMAAIPASILTLGSFFLPETPNSLIHRGSDQKAKLTLQNVRGTIDVQEELDDLINASSTSKVQNHRPFQQILQKKIRPQLALQLPCHSSSRCKMDDDFPLVRYIQMTYGIDLGFEDDSEERAIVLYQHLAQRTHQLYQPVPQEVSNRQFIDRHREEGDARMMHDYFQPNCTWGPKKFHQRLGMYRPLFLRILNKIVVADPFFDYRRDCTGKLGHSPHMKMYAVMKCLCKGIAADSTDDYVRMGATTIYMYVKRFARVIVRHFGPRYLRLPTAEDTRRLLAENAARGFPGMLGSVDCMHFLWKNCPTAWAGTFMSGHHRDTTIILEAVASYDRWFWHGFFGTPGSNNDLNVLAQSPLFDKMVNGLAAPCNYSINGHNYNMGYFLADNIYPRLSCIVQSYRIVLPNQHAKALFNRYQQAKRKDVERAFGTLQNKFQITKKPGMYWDMKDVKYIINACLILHNMVIENEKRALDWGEVVNEPVPQVQGIPVSHNVLRNDEAYLQLREDLVQHIWTRHGQGLRDGEMAPDSPPPQDNLDGSDGENDPDDVYLPD